MDIPDKDHVLRVVPYTKTSRDPETDAFISLNYTGFELREGESDLSVNWIEYNGGTDHDERVANTVASIRAAGRKVSTKAVLAIAKTEDVIASARQLRFNDVKIVHSPDHDTNNLSHASVIRMPYNDLGFMQALALDAFKEIRLCSEFT